MKFGQSREHPKNHAENEAGKLDLDCFLFFKKALY